MRVGMQACVAWGFPRDVTWVQMACWHDVTCQHHAGDGHILLAQLDDEVHGWGQHYEVMQLPNSCACAGTK